MTKTQKKMFKTLKRADHQAAFVDFLVLQQRDMGKYSHWSPAYAKKCKKKGVKPLKSAV